MQTNAPMTVPGPDPQGSHHWVMSVQWPETRRTAAGGATYRATITPEPGQTRAEIYEEIRAWVFQEIAEATGVQRPTVVFWSLEPNDLGGAS